jgi:hypothetical protein
MKDPKNINMKLGDRGFLVVDGRIVELEYVDWMHDDGGDIYFQYKYVDGGYHHSSYDEFFQTKEACRNNAIERLG